MINLKSIPNNLKLATRNDLKALRPSDEIFLFLRKNGEIVSGWITCVPKKIECIKDMEGSFIVHTNDRGFVEIGRRVWGNNISSLAILGGAHRGSINILISKTKSDIIRSVAKRQGMKVIDIKLPKSSPNDLDGLPISEAPEAKLEKPGRSLMVPVIDVPPVPNYGIGKSVVLYNSVALDMSGNFYDKTTSTPEITMEDLTKKVIACHQMSGTLDWLKNYIEQVEAGNIPPVNEFHKKRI